ncbi:CHAD domain-containing protein, partial [Acinetobacter pittii]|uniref:CHAD domain-containing protein n=1 Tax=Acinetobacter pittii TaxID=48296 RepID=UPI0013D0090D
LRGAIKRAFKTLGDARDLDIALAALRKGDARKHPPAALPDIRRRHDAAYARVTTMLGSRRFCLQMLDLLAFIEL